MNYVRNSSVECAPMKDETILYDPRTVRFCVLNPTASFLWERLASPRSASELLADLDAEYGIDDPAAAEREVQSALTELVALSFVEPGAAKSRDNGQPSGRPANRTASSRPAFAAPRLRVMDESEVLAQFQVTSAGATWWAT